eukprot:gene7006-7220_t
MARGAQRVEASQRARSGVVDATVVTLDRPVTQVRGPHGQLFNLKKQLPEEQLLLQQQVDDQQLLPAVRVFPAILQRALPQLGPPSRVKRMAQQHRSKQRRVPTAHQKLQQRGVVRRKATTLEKWDQAVKQQVQALVAAQQGRDMQLGCGMEASAVLPLPGLAGSSMVPPQPLLDVAQVQP